MILPQTYQNSLIRKNIYFLFIFFIFTNFLLYTKFSFSKEILPLVIINNELITNVDLENEIKIITIQNSNRKNLEQIAINNLIEQKIKSEEVKKNKIFINKKELNDKIINFLDKFKKKSINNLISENIKKLISEKIEIELKWNELIKKNYISQISINQKEIKDKIYNSKLDQKDIDKLILIEKNKKLLKFSKSHYNNIKKNYMIKFL